MYIHRCAKDLHPNDFGIPKEYWQKAFSYHEAIEYYKARKAAAPPAQTPVPPRLTDAELIEIYRQEHPVERRMKGNSFARAIESAVRKQFGVNDE
jgi:hypothetical protein